MSLIRTILPIAFASIGCVSDPSTGDAGKQTGEEGGPCFSDFTCKSGLICNRGPNVCVNPGTDGEVADTGSDGSPDTSDGPTEAMADAGPCPTTNLIAWWKGEVNGQDEQKNFDVSVTGFAFSPAKVGNGMVLDGTVFGESSPNSAQLYPTLDKMTIEGWILLAAVGNGTILSRQTFGGSGFTFGIVNGQLSFSFEKTTIVVGGTTVAVNTWYHVAVVYDSTSVKATLYVNGMPDGNGSTNKKVPSDAIGVRLGAERGQNSSVGVNDLHGTIDELAWYGSQLSSGDIQQIATGQMFTKCH